MAVVKGPLLGDFVNVAGRIFVIDQDQVALALLLGVEELAPVAQVLDEFPVAVDVGVQMPEALPRMRDTLGLSVARVELPHLGVEQVVEEERPALHPSGFILHPFHAAPPFGLLAGHKRPPDGLGVGEDSGLDGFVFSGFWHGQLKFELSTGSATLHLFSASGSRTYKSPRRASLVKSAVLFWPDDVHSLMEERFHLVGAWFCAMKLLGLGILGRKAVSGNPRSRLFRFRIKSRTPATP